MLSILTPASGPAALPSQNVKPTVPFNFSLDPNVFTDPDGDPLTYSAALQNQQPLPDWLTFNQTGRIFTGTPSAENGGGMSVNVTATDPFGAQAVRSFDLLVEGAPQLISRLSNLVANVGTKFNFIVPENTFKNPDSGIEDKIRYSAALTTGAALPAWLAFDATTITFTGTPGRKDTDLFSSRPLPIRLIASNNIGATSDDFLINVQGESDATLAIKIISGVGGAALAIGGAAYAKRKYVRLPTEHVIFGQESKYCHSITRLSPEKVASVQLLKDGQSLPGGIMRPDWFIYDNSNAKLTIDATTLKEQDGLTI